MLTRLASSSQLLIVAKAPAPKPLPIEVEDRKSGIRGRVDYDAAGIVEMQNYNDQIGRFAIPLVSADGKKHFLCWDFEGEFERFEGFRATCRGSKRKP